MVRVFKAVFVLLRVLMPFASSNYSRVFAGCHPYIHTVRYITSSVPGILLPLLDLVSSYIQKYSIS